MATIIPDASVFHVLTATPVLVQPTDEPDWRKPQEKLTTGYEPRW